MREKSQEQLQKEVVSAIQNLDYSALQRLSSFIAGLEAAVGETQINPYRSQLPCDEQDGV